MPEDSNGLSHSGQVTLSGPGRVRFSSANTYTGGTTVNAGTLIGNVPGAFGTGSLTINPTGTAGTAADAAVVYSNGSISPAANVLVASNSNSAIGTLSLVDKTPTINTLTGNGIVQLANPSGTTLSVGGGNASFDFSGSISDNGQGNLVKNGSGNFTLSGSDTFHGYTNVSAGTLTVSNVSALPAPTILNVAANASVVISNASSPIAITVSNISGGGIFDLTNNALVIHAGNLNTITAMAAFGYNAGAWNGTSGIVSSMAAADTKHLTAVAVIANDNGSGAPLYCTGGVICTTLDGASPTLDDVLVKYTYYGDTNLDGRVDASDYSKIDFAYLANQNSSNPALTGWTNRDFNYDGVINGSDYTLMDNAFNTQGAQLLNQISSPVAIPTAQISVATPSSVPEPASMLTPPEIIALLLCRPRKSPLIIFLSYCNKVGPYGKIFMQSDASFPLAKNFKPRSQISA